MIAGREGSAGFFTVPDRRGARPRLPWIRKAGLLQSSDEGAPRRGREAVAAGVCARRRYARNCDVTTLRGRIGASDRGAGPRGLVVQGSVSWVVLGRCME